MRRFPGHAAVSALTAGVCGLMASCAAEPVQTPLAQLGPAPAQPFPGPMMSSPSAQWIAEQYTDLPIPKGFGLLADQSFVFIQGKQRKADLSYVGAMPVRDLIRFYQESMAANRWQFLQLTGVRMKTLTYVKGDEIVQIVIQARPPPHEHRPEAEGERQFATHLYIQLD